MRITTAMTILAAAMATAAHAELQGQTVTVYVVGSSTVPSTVGYPAKTFVSRMFAEIGIRIEWRAGKPRAGAPGRPIEIVYDTNTPEDFRPGALAYALPFEGVHIHVLYDRVQRAAESSPTWLLAHVLVHEITHILQGVARHSPDGIMKAHWSQLEIAGMRRRPLPFTADDLKFIREGMDRRETGPVLTASLESAAAVAR